VIGRTVQRGGVIPAFAIGRTQSLVYYLWKLKVAGRLGLVPVYVDSPMAINATDLLCAHMDEHRMPPNECREACSIATYVRDTESSKALSANRMPKVIISASGMAAAECSTTSRRSVQIQGAPSSSPVSKPPGHEAGRWSKASARLRSMVTGSTSALKFPTFR
jgi:hypothetical protein